MRSSNHRWTGKRKHEMTHGTRSESRIKPPSTPPWQPSRLSSSRKTPLSSTPGGTAALLSSTSTLPSWPIVWKSCSRCRHQVNTMDCRPCSPSFRVSPQAVTARKVRSGSHLSWPADSLFAFPALFIHIVSWQPSEAGCAIWPVDLNGAVEKTGQYSLLLRVWSKWLPARITPLGGG